MVSSRGLRLNANSLACLFDFCFSGRIVGKLEVVANVPVNALTGNMGTSRHMSGKATIRGLIVSESPAS